MPNVSRHAPHVRHSVRGFIGLMTIIVMGAVILTVGLVVSYAGQTQITMAGMFEREQSAREAATACVEEALHRLTRDSSYAGGTVPVGVIGCTSTVTGSGDSRQVTVTANDGDMTSRVTATVERRQNASGSAFGWVVESWQETLP